MKLRRKIIPFLLVPAFLSGCALTGQKQIDIKDAALNKCWKENVSDQVTAEKANKLDDKEAQIHARQSLKDFFRCYLGPDDLPKKDEARKELLLLRHHAVLTMLTEYAAYKFDGKVKDLQIIKNPDYNDSAEDAQEVLGAIQKTERSLRVASKKAKELFRGDKNEFTTWDEDFSHRPEFKEAIYELEYLDRIIRTADIIRRAQKPGFKRFLRGLAKTSALLKTVTSANLSTNMQSIRNLVLNFTILKNLYGKNQMDLRNYLNCVQQREDSAPKKAPSDLCKGDFAADWARWDKNLQRACTRLSNVIEKGASLKVNSEHICVPAS
ncbi:MAG: hypothetical protein HWE30_11280 [Methylocystaceae bacterium]|nr:hypothetical protein [Methylocystaceae bacterium]